MLLLPAFGFVGVMQRKEANFIVVVHIKILQVQRRINNGVVRMSDKETRFSVLKAFVFGEGDVQDFFF